MSRDDDQGPSTPAPGPAPAGGAPPDPQAIFTQFNDLFADMFGGPRSGSPRGADRQQDLTVFVSEAREGCERRVSVVRRMLCGPCAGSGARGGVTLACADCQGQGRVQRQAGFLQLQSVCAACRGAGRTAASPCPDCVHGLRQAGESLNVRIPPGSADGLVLRCAGKGDEVAGGPAGDLHLCLRVQPDVLVRRGDDVVVEAHLEPHHLLRGGRVEVPTLDGPMAVEVPGGVTEGDTLMVPGRGYPRSGPAAASPGSDPYRQVARGDQVVVFRVADARSRLRSQAFWIGLGVAASTAIVWAALVLGR